MDLEKGKESLLESFLRVGDNKKVISSLEYILENNSPLALYVATLDHSNCSWIFNPDVIKDMLKSFNTSLEELEEKIIESTGQNLEEQDCVLFFIFTKVDPLVSAIIPAVLLEEVIEELYDKS